MDSLPWQAITAASGGWVLTAAYTYAVLTGRLVPRSTLDSQTTLLNERIDDEQHEKGEWRTESRIKDQHIAEADEQNKLLTREIAATLKEFLASIRPGTNGEGDGR